MGDFELVSHEVAAAITKLIDLTCAAVQPDIRIISVDKNGKKCQVASAHSQVLALSSLVLAERMSSRDDGAISKRELVFASPEYQIKRVLHFIYAPALCDLLELDIGDVTKILELGVRWRLIATYSLLPKSQAKAFEKIEMAYHADRLLFWRSLHRMDSVEFKEHATGGEIIYF